MARNKPTPDELAAWAERTRTMHWAPDRVDDGLVSAAELRLVNRLVRLRRFVDMEAPDIIMDLEKGMVAQAIAWAMGVDKAEDFSLPSLTEVRAARA